MQQTYERDVAALRIMFGLDQPFEHRKLFNVQRIKGNDIGLLEARDKVSHRVRVAACAYMTSRLDSIR